MKKLFCLLIVLFLIGCGGSGGGGSSSPAPAPAPVTVTSPSEDLTGTYSLTGFTVSYSNGQTLTEHSSGVTSWSGTMKIGSPTFTQSMAINNTPVAMQGTATVTWQNSTNGIAHVTEQSGTKHDVSFSISGNSLTTYSGVVQSSTPGLTFQEWDYWLKVSDSLSPELLNNDEKQKDQTTQINAKWIGEVFNP